MVLQLFCKSNPIVPVGNGAKSEIGDGIIPIKQNNSCLQIVMERVWPVLEKTVNQIEAQGVATNIVDPPKIYSILKLIEVDQ